MSVDERDALLLQTLQALSEQSNAESEDSCTSGLLGMIMQKDPSAKNCVAPCRSSCGTLNTLLSTYMTKGGQPALNREACKSHNKDKLQCFFHHIGPCMGLINKAKGYGVTIPSSSGQLNGMCRR